MSQVKFQFDGKVAFVTGASTGIGRATAVEFAKGGAKVAVVDVNDDAALKTVKLVQDAGTQGIFIKCDVSKSVEVKSAVEKTLSQFGRIDFAFNNAGIEGEQGATHNQTEENWDRVLNTNLKGIWLCMKYQIPVMLKQGGGSIVNCSSIAGLVGFPGIPAYDASKHGVIGLTQTAALEYAKMKLRINAVCPGVIKTPMIDRFTRGDKTAEAGFESAEPVGRMGLPEEIASAVLWLSSDGASFVTGQQLVVDGGWVAQ